MTACDSEETPEIEQVEKKPEVQLSQEESIVRYIESALRIPATEKYSYKTYESDCDGDPHLDLVITVNLLQRALDEAKTSGNIAKRASVGYMGNYNFVIYMDGMTQKFSQPLPIASSPHAELEVSFERIVKDNYNDIMVDYRVRNSGFRDFFTVVNKYPNRTLQLKCFDGIGDPETESFFFEYEQGSGVAKNVLMYKGTFENITPKDPMEVYSFKPKVTSTGELERKWFYSPQARKFYTRLSDTTLEGCFHGHRKVPSRSTDSRTKRSV